MASDRLARYEYVVLALLLAVSLALRLGALDAFLTTDEALWSQRSADFADALRRHEWQATYQAGHPGVVTMWLGAIAGRLQFLQEPSPLAGQGLRWLLHDPQPAPGTGVPPLTLGSRRLVALATWLGIAGLFLLLRRLFDGTTALLATGLVALDPFLLAHSRFHHLDGLLATFSTLSVVALLVYQLRERRPGCLLISAATAGLAVANKSPGVLLVPWAGLALVAPSLLQWKSLSRREVLGGTGAFALWVLVGALVFGAVWPAMWVSPMDVLRNVFGVARHYAETPHEFSSFFWFAARPDPGPGFYPVVWALRTTPWVLLGLAALAVCRCRPGLRAVVMLLLVWVVLYASAMTAAEKKLDRYLLPVFPVLDILAAVGLLAALRRWLGSSTSGKLRLAPIALAAGVIAGQFALAWSTRPYYISYYNPLLGGARTAARLVRVGWGEGLDRAAAFLNGLADAEDTRVIVWNHQDFVPFFRGHNVGGAEAVPLAEADYYVFYINEVQRGLVPVASQFVGQREPEYVVNLNGLDYAWVFRNTYYEEAAGKLLSQIEQRADPERDALLFDVDAACARHYDGALPVRVLTGEGRSDHVRSGLQRLLAGSQGVWHVTFAGAPQAISATIDDSLAQRGTLTDEISVEGMRAVHYELAAGARFVPKAPPIALDAQFGQHIRLLGYETSRSDLVPGQPVRVTFYWQATGPIETSYTVFAHLRDATGYTQTQLDSPPAGGQRLTADWEPGEILLDEREFQLPGDAPPGPYTVAVGLYDRTTMQRLEAYDEAGRPLSDNAVIVQGWQVGS